MYFFNIDYILRISYTFIISLMVIIIVYFVSKIGRLLILLKYLFKRVMTISYAVKDLYFSTKIEVESSNVSSHRWSVILNFAVICFSLLYLLLVYLVFG